MESEEPELNATLAQTDSATTNESVQHSNPQILVDKHTLYLRSRQIALKKFRPQGGNLN
jgi:hypothetical protein